MNRPCNKGVVCDTDPVQPFTGYSAGRVNPSAKLCLGITGNCGANPFTNFSSACDDADHFSGRNFACGCLGDNFFQELRAPGFGPWTFTITGSVPPGIDVLVNEPCPGYVIVQGNYLQEGRYFFTVNAVDGFGNRAVVTFQFNVLVILTLALPSPTLGSPYFFQLEAAGGSGRYAWKILTGAIAPGLQLFANGTISGTPTGTMPPTVTFRVIDYECEQPDTSFFSPFVELVGASTTMTATIIGWPGFDTSLKPPTAYKGISWGGGASNVGLGIGQFVSYCGFTQIDSRGNPIFNFNGQICKFAQGYLQCFGGGCLNVTFHGPCFFGQAPVSQIFLDTYCPAGPNQFRHGPDATFRDAFFPITGEAMNYTFVSGDTHAERDVFAINSAGTIISVARSVDLFNQYTDAEAVANAAVTNGTGLVASNFPRTTGYVSTTTSVVYTLNFHNLMPGQNYVGSVLLFNSDGTTSLRQYPFTASAQDHTITDSIPTPPANKWTLVGQPTIAFAP